MKTGSVKTKFQKFICRAPKCYHSFWRYYVPTPNTCPRCGSTELTHRGEVNRGQPRPIRRDQRTEVEK